ncbi:MAG: cobalamin-dependent protein [Deltaproteobacteria bacterium]|nr:cobalamin-dependent protein [Deltaproteobacteria bacterium]
MENDVLQNLQNSIYDFDEDQAIKYTEQALNSGLMPLQIVEDALRPCLNKMGEDFEKYEIGLPELVVVGDIATQLGKVLEDALGDASALSDKGSIALGTVKGDLHTIGKDIVCVMMKASGFKVADLGGDVSPERFLEMAQDMDAIGLSGLLTLATRSMRKTIELVNGNCPGKIILVGGAAMEPQLASDLGVLYGANANEGVSLLTQALVRKNA